MAQKQVLLDVKVNLKESLKEIAEMKLRQTELLEMEKSYKSEIKELEKAISEKNNAGIAADEAELKRLADLRASLVMSEERRKAYGREIGEQSRKVQNTIVAEEKYKDTLKGLCAQLSIAKDELRAMKVTDPGFAEKTEEVGILNERIKEMEASYGVYSRNVGNYGMAINSTKEEIAECIAKLSELTAAGKANSKEYEEQRKKLSDLNATMQEGNDKSIDFANNGLAAVMGGMTIMQQVMGTDTAEGKKLQETMQKLQIAVMAVSVATELYQTVQKKGLIQKTAENIQVKAGAAAIRLEAKARTQATGATIAQTVAQKALNAVMKANPILLIISAIAVLVTGIIALVKAINSSASAQKDATNAQMEYERQVRKTSEVVATQDAILMENTAKITRAYQTRMSEMMKSGAKKEQLDKVELEMNNALRESELARNKVVLEAQKNELVNARANYALQKKYLDELIARKGKDAKKTKEQEAAVSEALKNMRALEASVNSTVKDINDSLYESVKHSFDKQVEAAEKAYTKMMSAFERRTQIVEKLRRRNAQYVYDDTKSELENAEEKYRTQMIYEAQLFNYQQKRAAESLALQRKNRKITAEEYKDALALLKLESDNFVLEQNESYREHFRGLVSSAIDLAGGKDLYGQLKDMKDKYAAAEKAIKDDTVMEADEKAFYLTRLAEKQAQEEKSIRLAYTDNTNSEIAAKLEQMYKNDLRQWSASESERLSLEIDKQRDIIAEKKKAGQQTYADEVALAQLEANLRAVLAEDELTMAWKNADEQYRIQKEYLEKELEMANLSAEQRAYLEAQLADLTVEQNNRKLESVENYTSQSMDLLNSVNELMNAIAENQIVKDEAKNESAKEDLDKRLKSGLISQAKYDKEVAKMDADLDKKKAKIAREQAIRERTLSSFQVAINTAAAIMRIWADVPKVDFGVSTGVLTGIASAIGAAQLAAIWAAPIPQARKGGLVQGPTHENGGVLINTEGDERIVSADVSRAFPELLNLISYIGKHAGIPDTGYASRAMLYGPNGSDSVTPIDVDELVEKFGAKMSELLKDLKIYTSIQEIRETDKLYTEIENSAKM